MRKLIVTFLFCLCCSVGTAYAITVPFEQTYLNYDESLDGQTFDWRAYDSEAEWLVGPAIVGFSLDYIDWESASLSLILGGAGKTKAPEIFLNDIFVGTVSIGDGEYLGMNQYAVDTWELSDEALDSLVMVANSLDIRASWDDGWALEGLKIAGLRTIENGGGTAPVPEPATMLLVGTGLAGVAAIRRRKNQRN